MSNDELDTYMNLSDRGQPNFAQLPADEEPDAGDFDSVNNAKHAEQSKYINKYEDDFTELVWENDADVEITAAK
jgi:hypothetical protein